jgi:DNA-binding CsgD family transcriptional regulator
MKAKSGAHSPGLSGNWELPLPRTSYIDTALTGYEAPKRPELANRDTGNHRAHAHDEQTVPSPDVTTLVIIVGRRGAASASSLVHWIESMPGISVAQVTDFASVYLYCQRGDTTALIDEATEAAVAVTGAGAGVADQVDELPIEQLSSREFEVFQMLSQGMSNRQLARSLGITERTVKAHIGSIMRKLGLQSRLQVGLAAFARYPDGASSQTG